MWLDVHSVHTASGSAQASAASASEARRRPSCRRTKGCSSSFRYCTAAAGEVAAQPQAIGACCCPQALPSHLSEAASCTYCAASDLASGTLASRRDSS